MPRMRRIGTAVALAVAGCAFAGVGIAADDDDRVPKWEIGMVGGAGWAPHYPSAEQGGATYAVSPYFKYRAKWLRLGDDGLASSRLVRTDDIRITVSLSGSIPTNSENNRARAGMPDLDSLFEVGPQVEVLMFERENIDSLRLKLPFRVVSSTDLDDIEYRGFVVHPRISYSRERLFGDSLSGTASLGPVFASDHLMDYFYDVTPIFATPDRPAYEATGGYLGTDLTFSLRYQVTDRVKLFIGTRSSFLHGNVNADSPLYRKSVNHSVGVGFAWRIWESERTVEK